MARKKSFTESWIFPFLLHVVVITPIFWYAYSVGYFRCLLTTPVACLTSTQYRSPIGAFAFRYPSALPLSHREEKELAEQWGFAQGKEVINFSYDFNLDAGGNRLGSIVVSKNAEFTSVEDYINAQLQNLNRTARIDAVRIGGQRWACSTESENAVSIEAPSFNCVTVHGGLLYQIFFEYNPAYHKESLSAYQRQRLLILTTFHFLQ